METFIINAPYIDSNIEAIQAKTTDTKQVEELLFQTAKWLQNRGSTQWNELLDGYDKHGTTEAITRGEVFLFKEDKEIVGMVVLLQKPSQWDLNLWGEEEQDKSIYLHRLISNREYSGRQLGRKILTWSEQGIHFPSKNQIRLDCISNNPILNDFYRSMGYTFKGTSPSGFNKYEKRI